MGYLAKNLSQGWPAYGKDSFIDHLSSCFSFRGGVLGHSLLVVGPSIEAR